MRAKIIALIRAQKLPVDVLGIQSHLDVDYELKSGKHTEWKIMDEVMLLPCAKAMLHLLNANGWNSPRS